MITTISKLGQYADQEVTLQGWMFNKRGNGKLFFLQIRDGSGTTQAVVDSNSVSPEVFQKAEDLTMESSLRITGKVSKHPKLENTFELQVTDIEIVHLV